jgi:hypothetical protein
LVVDIDFEPLDTRFVDIDRFGRIGCFVDIGHFEGIDLGDIL